MFQIDLNAIIYKTEDINYNMQQSDTKCMP